MNIKPLLIHLPLEPYKGRYTEMLSQWEKEAFSKYFEVTSIEPDLSVAALDIKTGEVLDAKQRSLYSLRQMFTLLTTQFEGAPIYFSDFFTPGIEALLYTTRQGIRSSLTIGAFCWAQTFDKFDFTRNLMPWMRLYEILVGDYCDHIFVAHPLLAELAESVVPSWEKKLHCVGLPFNSKDVYSRVALDKVDPKRPYDVVFSSRLDREKDPLFFLQLVNRRPDLQFVICSPHPRIKTNDLSIRQELERTMAKCKNLNFFNNLSRPDYYAILASSKVIINTSLQDWVSFTLLEALTFGCSPVYPHWRSFPSTLNYNLSHLYSPGNLEDASYILAQNLSTPMLKEERQDILSFHDGTLDRIAQLMRKI